MECSLTTLFDPKRLVSEYISISFYLFESCLLSPPILNPFNSDSDWEFDSNHGSDIWNIQNALYDDCTKSLFLVKIDDYYEQSLMVGRFNP